MDIGIDDTISTKPRLSLPPPHIKTSRLLHTLPLGEFSMADQPALLRVKTNANHSDRE
jgi:hypothetical protein